MKDAWNGWKFATKLLLWAFVERVTNAIAMRAKAQDAMLCLEPNCPRDVYDNGFALFHYDIGTDAMVGHWRTEEQRMRGLFGEQFETTGNWLEVPKHAVKFKDAKYSTYGGFTLYAVPLEYARKHLKPWNQRAAA